METVKLDKWLPDLIPFGSPDGALSKAYNLLPDDFYYSPAKNKVAYSTDTVTGTALNAKEFSGLTGTKYVYIGTTTKLLRMNADKTITNLTRQTASVDVDYTASATANFWRFAQYGTQIIATDFVDVIQSKADIATTGKFAALTASTGSIPRCKFLLLNNGHLILAYLNDGTERPKKIQWSGFEDPTAWAASLTTGADSQDFPDADGERITGIANVGEYVAIFFDESITIGSYVGAPYTFDFSGVNRVKGIGAIEGTIVSVGGVCYFWSKENLYMFNGSTAEPIGTGISNYVLDLLNTGYYNRNTAAFDAKRGIIFWAFCSTAASTPNKILAYNWRNKRFTITTVSSECIFNLSTGALLMDAIDAIYPSLDAIPYELDSNFWQANTKSLGCVDSATSKVATFSGTALTGTIETAEFKAGDDVTTVRRCRPKVSEAVDTVSVRAAARVNEDDTAVFTNSSNVGSSGYADLRCTGRFHKFEITTGLHSGIYDLEIDVAKAGER